MWPKNWLYVLTAWKYSVSVIYCLLVEPNCQKEAY